LNSHNSDKAEIDPDALHKQGREEYNAGYRELGLRHLKEANALWVEKWQAVIDKTPANHNAREQLAYYLTRAGKTEAAQAEYDKLTAALSLDDDDRFFHHTYNQGLMRTGTSALAQRRARFRSLVKHFEQTLPMSGDIAECGCFRGLSAFTLCHYLKRQNPHFTGQGFHLFDSFQGLSAFTEKDSADSDKGEPGKFACSENKVRANLAAFPRIKFYPGWIPTRFHEVKNRKFKFLNLDVDIYEPTRDSIRFFYPRLVPGGVIVCDDYNWSGARTAIEECKAELGFEVMETGYNQAVIKKI